jgi:hypothetical protein
MKKTLKIILGLSPALMVATALILSSSRVLAFNANDLMDDGIFENSGSMSAVQIDNFLNSFPSSCISLNNGFTTPDPTGWTTTPNSTHGYTFGGNVSAGQAIYDAAQNYHVNPQVILATMQKEQSAVTGSAGCHGNGTSPGQACPYAGGCLDIVMGYACPSGCDDSYKGFSLQLIAGTWLLRFAQQRAYGNLTGYAGHDPNDENICYGGPMTAGNRQRSASSSTCKGAPGNTMIYYDGSYTTQNGTGVTIANGATAALYYYTPFTSGNQNFDNIFTSWFGPIYNVYSWSLVNQYAYTDSSKTTPVDLTNLLVGQKVYVGFQATNTGDTTWSNSGNNPIDAGTTSPQDRNSAFCDASDSPAWLGCNRPARMIESSVAPGQTGTFEFWYQAPTQAGTYEEHFSLVAEGLEWMNDNGLYFHTVVKPPTYSWSLVNQYAYTDNTKTTAVDLTTLAPSQRVYIGFQARNIGNITWSNSGVNPVRTGTSNPTDRNSSFCDPTWLGCNRPSAMTESSVAPGQIATFEFWYKAPSQPGTYFEHFTPLAEGLQWMNDTGMNFYTVVHFDASGANMLGVNQALNIGQFITSADGRYRLFMQDDGNLVLYSINRALWSSGTAGRPAVKVIMQGDGNLVLYDAQNKAYWASGTAGRGVSSLIMQSDGNLVIYDSSGHPTWVSYTNGQL